MFERMQDQQKRNRAAWVLLVVLAPVFVYAMVSTVGKVRGQGRPASAAVTIPIAVAPDSVPASTLVHDSLALLAETRESSLDPKIRAEQKRLAGLLPERDPFVAGQAVEKPSGLGDAASLRFTGFVNHAQSSKRLAIIDGKMLKEGESIRGWTILKIRADGVLLGAGNQTVTVARTGNN